MNSRQKTFKAFIESTCTKYGCKEAIAPLQEGFAALCEGLLEDDPFGNEPENPFERTCTSCGRRIPDGHPYSRGLCPECEKDAQSYMYPDDGPEEPQQKYCRACERELEPGEELKDGLCPDCYHFADRCLKCGGLHPDLSAGYCPDCRDFFMDDDINWEWEQDFRADNGLPM